MLKDIFQKYSSPYKSVKNTIISLETCKKCPYHAGYEMGQIYCKCWNNLNSVATTKSSMGEIIILNCPKEN